MSARKLGTARNDDSDSLPLPHLRDDFAFGVSSAAFGIEGSWNADGRGPSIWDAVSAAPGRIADGSTGHVAAGHLARHREDVDLLSDLGIDAYRFSISWSRVQPDGAGPGNQPGLDFYDVLVDQLLAKDIQPIVTLYHWDLPLALMLQGGWLERDTAEAAGDFAGVVADRIGDRVRHWTTLADPLSHMAYGHALGVDAPGLTLLDEAFPVTHHLLLGHARMLEALRSADHVPTEVGISLHHTAVTPADDSPPAIRAAALYDSYHNRQFTDPILLGRYPRLLQPLLDRFPGTVRDGDLQAISAPIDSYGVHYFHPTAVAAAPDNNRIPFALVQTPDTAVTDFEWPVHAPSLTTVLTDLHRRYPRLPPLVVAENGAAYDDRPGPDHGSPAPDRERIDYLRDHLLAVDDAAAAGVDVRGYFHRGLTDAWEGSEGFTRHFGLVRVDRQTQDRSPRASFEFFQQVISTHHRDSRRSASGDDGTV